MKKLFFVCCAVFSVNCLAAKNVLQTSVDWLSESLPDDIDLTFNSSGVRFQGCKHSEYQISFNQPLSENWLIHSSLVYAKGRLNWGVFSQKVSMFEWSVEPRLQITDRFSLGLGLVARSQATFKTTQGQVFDLPQNTEWLITSRIQAHSPEHFWQVSLSSQKWDSSNDSGTWFERGLADNQIKLSYQGAF